MRIQPGLRILGAWIWIDSEIEHERANGSVVPQPRTKSDTQLEVVTARSSHPQVAGVDEEIECNPFGDWQPSLRFQGDEVIAPACEGRELFTVRRCAAPQCLAAIVGHRVGSS